MQKAIFPFIAVEVLSKKFLKLSFKLHLYLKGWFVHTGICVPLAAAELQPQLSKGGKIRSTELTSCLLLLLQKFYLKKLSVDFCCCAELVNRVSFLEYLGHDPIPPTVPKPGSERFQLWVKNYFN